MTCCGKKAYDSRWDADFAMRRVLILMNDQHPAQKRPRSTYQCPLERWHFTSWSPLSDTEALRVGTACLPKGDTPLGFIQQEILERDGFHCVLCMSPRRIRVAMRGAMEELLGPADDEDAKSWRRNSMISNLITLCPVCERYLRADPDMALLAGLVIGPGADPRAKAVYWNRRWVYLNENGTIAPIG